MKDWRNAHRQNYLYRQELILSEYHPYSKQWDHDHCEFCGAVFSENEGDLHFGYSAGSGSWWICKDCFEDFKDVNQWTVTESETKTQP